ncbi:MAG: hypothetical protein H6696_11145 [Deferribacteres bacterium]|nr:hypothetical protein [candidate division KSB1 bacterium]MCB9502488.1 hypothetical protein [Deferribacteres bacterium]
MNSSTFAADMAFMAKYKETIVLENKTGQAKVLVVPDYQGRVMTSTAAGNDGVSFGWLNYELIASGKLNQHINAFGGEDRFWLGPEGGQFSLFFKAGDAFDLEHWQTPAPIDSEPFEVKEQSQSHVTFQKNIHLVNYSNTAFSLDVERDIRLLNDEMMTTALGSEFDPTVQAVAFETVNKVTNSGAETWKKETGLLSIWILGMFNPSASTTIVIPLKDEAVVNDSYFGKVPADRLVVKNGIAYFKGDGQYRSKIGVPPSSAKPIMGSYDSLKNVLTIVQFSFDTETKDYVNSAWELQDHPFAGDVLNSYNDGPPAPGAKPLGPFYELESSSAAKELAPGETLTHIHRTFHFVGQKNALNAIAQSQFGVGLAEIESAL